MKYLCLAVPKNRAEHVRRELLKMNLLLKNVKVERDSRYVYFPVRERVDFDNCLLIEKEMKEMEMESFRSILAKKGIEIESLSIDFIGDIAVIRADEEKAMEVADAIMKTNKKVKAVFLDRGVKEDYRVRELEHLMGEKKTATIHVEYGVRIKVDVAKAYFSPRLSAERMRVAKQVEEGSIVIDMFAGVAPFSLIIAKYAKPRKIYAIDKNPHAVKYARENVKMNKMDEIIEVIEGDASEILPSLPQAKHIIMNLPHKSFYFLPVAMKKGEIIHYYEIMERGKINERIEEVKKVGKELGYGIEVKNVRVVGSYSPAKQRIGMEIYVRRQ